jgi:carbon-monoxide dehydrogenase small subunit
MTPPQEAVAHRPLALTVNGTDLAVNVEDRELLVSTLREGLRLTGTHVGCLNGDCGACTVRIDGRIAKSCLVLSCSVDGACITTIEGHAPRGQLDDLQTALWREDAFQCGFCLPGHLFALDDLISENPDADEIAVRKALEGNLCRCTGYVNLVRAACTVIEQRRAAREDDEGPG